MSHQIPPSPEPVCLLSFDVEEYFHTEAARPVVPRAHWPNMPSRLEAMIDYLLERLAQHGSIATFFTLGWIARRQPRLVRRIADAGHEIASHGHCHERLHRLSPITFARDLRDARCALEDAGGQAVSGYRAPTFSLTSRTAWAVDVLCEQGYAYDSSVQPIAHPQYGEPMAPRQPYRLTSAGGNSIAEIPPLTWQMGPMRWPVAGGGYFRLLPLAMMRWGIDQAARVDQPAMLYFHPWEFDPDQPRLPLSAISRWRTYTGLSRTRDRFDQLLSEYRGQSVGQWIRQQDTQRWPQYQLLPTRPSADSTVNAGAAA